MREIKFRAWDKQHKEMLYDGLEYQLRLIQTPNDINSNIEAIPLGFTRVDHAMFDIMQFTGLTDKNGVEIYESDIVRYSGGIESGEGLICFSAGFTIEWNLSTVKSSMPSLISPLFYFQCSSELDVIGNIHQHRHLL